MKHSTWFAAALFCLPTVLTAAGCGDDDEAAPDGAVVIDADETPDAKPMIDAAATPDATPPDLSCRTAPDGGPVQVPSTITITGQVRTQGLGASAPVFDAGVAAFAATDDNTPLAQTFSVPVFPVDAGPGQPDAGPPTTAAYSLEVPTNNQPLVGYVRFQAPSGGETIVPNYVYSPRPLVADAQVTVPMFPSSLLDLLQSVAGVTQKPERGLALVTVSGCPDDMGRRPAIAEAVVTVSTADAETKVVYLDTSSGFGFGDKQTFASGVAFVFNIPPGPFEVTAKYSDITFTPNKVKAFAGPSATATSILP